MPSAPSMPSIPPVNVEQVPSAAELDAEAEANVKKSARARRSAAAQSVLGGGIMGTGLPPVARKTLLSGVA